MESQTSVPAMETRTRASAGDSAQRSAKVPPDIGALRRLIDHLPSATAEVQQVTLFE